MWQCKISWIIVKMGSFYYFYRVPKIVFRRFYLCSIRGHILVITAHNKCEYYPPQLKNKILSDRKIITWKRAKICTLEGQLWPRKQRLYQRRFKWCDFSRNFIWYCVICSTLSTCRVVFPSDNLINYASSYRKI